MHYTTTSTSILSPNWIFLFVILHPPASRTADSICNAQLRYESQAQPLFRSQVPESDPGFCTPARNRLPPQSMHRHTHALQKCMVEPLPSHLVEVLLQLLSVLQGNLRKTYYHDILLSILWILRPL